MLIRAAGLPRNQPLIARAYPTLFIREQLSEAVHGHLWDQGDLRPPRLWCPEQRLYAGMALLPRGILLAVKDVVHKAVRRLIVRHDHAYSLPVHVLCTRITG